MRKHLTSHLTIFYKIIFPTIWTLIILGMITLIFIDSNDPRAFFIIIMVLPMLLTIRIKQVTYDDKNIHVYNWRATRTYSLKDIKAINEGSMMSLDPFFELEIREKNGTIKKVDFMPKVSEQLTFMFTKKYSGHLLDLRTKIVNSKQS